MSDVEPNHGVKREAGAVQVPKKRKKRVPKVKHMADPYSVGKQRSPISLNSAPRVRQHHPPPPPPRSTPSLCLRITIQQLLDAVADRAQAQQVADGLYDIFGVRAQGSLLQAIKEKAAVVVKDEREVEDFMDHKDMENDEDMEDDENFKELRVAKALWFKIPKQSLDYGNIPRRVDSVNFKNAIPAMFLALAQHRQENMDKKVDDLCKGGIKKSHSSLKPLKNAMLFFCYDPEKYSKRYEDQTLGFLKSTQEKTDIRDEIRKAHEEIGETEMVKVFHKTFKGFKTNALWLKKIIADAKAKNQ